jgi:hypothetical protein
MTWRGIVASHCIRRSLTDLVSLQEDSKRARRCARRCRGVVFGTAKVPEGEVTSDIAKNCKKCQDELRAERRHKPATEQEV